MERHITIIAAFNIAMSVFGVGFAMLVFIVMVGSGFLAGDALPFAITSFIGTSVALVITVSSALTIIGSIGLMKHKSWARIMMLILSVLALFNIPFGTIVGVYTIWVLMKEDTIRLFEQPAYAA